MEVEGQLVSELLDTSTGDEQDLDHGWSLRPATISSFDPTTMLAGGVFDGDAEIVPMISLIGYVSRGTRVFAIRIPPSGVYIIGGNTRGSDFIAYAGPKTSNTAASSSTDVGVVNVSGIPTVIGNVYRIFTTTLNMTPSASGLTGEARLRYDDAGATATNASTQIGSAQLEGVATFVPRGSSVLQTEHTAVTNVLSLFLGWALIGGAGTATLQGSTASPVVMYVQDMGRRPSIVGNVL